MMEDLKKKVNGVYGWSVEDGKPKPPKQDLPQAVRDRADYFWEMTEDGMTFMGAMECIFADEKPKDYDLGATKRWLPKSKEFDDWVGYSPGMSQVVIAVYLIYGGNKMNKQELIEKIGNLDKLYGEKFYVALDDVLDLVKQLDEPGKVQIPQSVADWIEYCKVRKITLDHALYHSEEAKNKSVYRWLFEDEDSDNQETFARAWLDGYEVEKEKLYLVKIKGVNEECEYLVFGELSNTWKLRSLGSFGELRKHHTRKELEEAGFGWVFSCEGIDIEEVE